MIKFMNFTHQLVLATSNGVNPTRAGNPSTLEEITSLRYSGRAQLCTIKFYLGSSSVERCPEEAGVASSTLALGTRELYRAKQFMMAR